MEPKIAASSQAVRERQGSRGTRRVGRSWGAPPRSSTTHATATTHAPSEKRDERPAPAAEHRRDRHGERGRDGRAELDARRVDARPGGGALGHRLAHDERRERVPEPHPDAHGPGEQDHEPGARRDRAEDAEEADQRERDRHRAPRSEPRAEVRRDRREEAHAEDGNRPEQADERVRGVEVVLDLLDQRADPDDLRTQRERRQEEPREGGDGAARAQRLEPGGLLTRLRAIRANASTCLRASRPAAAGGPERIASRIGTCSSAASCGSTYVP